MFEPACRNAATGLFVLSLLSLVGVPRAVEAGTTSCNIPQACALYSNASGPGLAGTSAKNEGIVGTTTFAGTSTSNRTYGVEGIDGSTNKSVYNVGVYGTSPYGLGLYGISPNGSGVYGTTTSGFGVRATASSGTAISGTSSTGNGVLGQTSGTSSLHAGVTGADLSTNGGINDGVLGTTTSGGYGVEGRSSDGAYGGVAGSATNGAGVRGSSSSGYGVTASSVSGFGLFANGSTAVYASGTSYGAFGTSSSGIGVVGQSGSGPGLSASSSSGDAIDASSAGGIAVHASNTSGNGADILGSYIGLLGRSDNYPLVLTNTGGSNIFQVDGSGNVRAHGSYGTLVATRGGAMSTAFTTRSTTPNVEDVGSAQLVNGVASVAFDAAFGASIDPHAVYHVFLTPSGDTRGLYVATKTPAGFVVRETQGGRGTLAFDYRIVAAAPGHAGERMALVAAARVVEPKAAIVTRPALPKVSPVAPPSLRSVKTIR